MLDARERASEQLDAGGKSEAGAGGEDRVGREVGASKAGSESKVGGEYRIGSEDGIGGESEAGGEDRVCGSGQTEGPGKTTAAVPTVNTGCIWGGTEAGETRAASGLNQINSTQANSTQANSNQTNSTLANEVGQTPAYALRFGEDVSPYPHFVCGGSVSEKLQKLASEMPSAEILGDLADLYKNFGDSTRLSILSALRVKELCVSDLAELLSMTPSAISHQLRSLRDHNLIRYRREGKTVTYSLADEHVELMIDMGLEHLMELE